MLYIRYLSSFIHNYPHSCTAAIVAENLLQNIPPDGFFGIEILQNLILAGGGAGGACDACPDLLAY